MSSIHISLWVDEFLTVIINMLEVWVMWVLFRMKNSGNLWHELSKEIYLTESYFDLKGFSFWIYKVWWTCAGVKNVPQFFILESNYRLRISIVQTRKFIIVRKFEFSIPSKLEKTKTLTDIHFIKRIVTKTSGKCGV